MAKTVALVDKGPTLQEIRAIAADSSNVVLLSGASKKGKRRGITHAQVVKCCQLGTIHEGPMRNERFDWQVTMCRHGAGEEIRVVVILKDSKLLVRSNH